MNTNANPHSKPEEHFLSNGIPVILQHLEGSVGTLHWWNKVGSTDERPHEAGFAHFLEHMLFKDAGAKDTGQASQGKTARLIESLGGEINAYTTFDQTVYHVTCAEKDWEKIIGAFGVMAKPQRFLKSDFEREREVILEELRRGEDNPDRMMYQKLFGLTYQKHPYGRPVIGFVKTLKAATVSTLEAFYKRNYVSSRMGVVLVGPIETPDGKRKKKLLQLLEKHYGKGAIPKKAAPERVRPVEPETRKKPSFLAHHFDVKSPEIVYSFRIPELRHEDAAGLEVLAGVLGLGESARLYQKLFYEQALVTDVSASTYIPKDSGMFLLSAEAKQTSDLEKINQSLIDELVRIEKHGVTKEELSRIITNLESDKLYSTQTVDGLASRLGSLWFSVEDPKFDVEYLERIKATTSHQLQLLVKKYLEPSRMSVVVFQPKEETLLKESVILSAWDSRRPSKETLKPKTKKLTSNEPELFTTPHGIRVSYFPRSGSSVYSLYASFLGGTRMEFHPDSKENRWGISGLFSSTWTKGTQHKTSKEIRAIVEGSAASLDAFAGRNTVGLQSTGLFRDWEKLSNLFIEVLTEPKFDSQELEHSRRVALENLKSLPNHSSQVCSKLFMETLFENHPYGKLPLSDENHLNRYQIQDLQKLHAEWIKPSNMSLAIVGSIPRAEMEDFVSRVESGLLKTLEKNGQTNTFSETKWNAEPALKGPRFASVDFGREQTHIMMGGLGIDMNHPDRFALKILQNILGGQSGRLFIELREKRSMAYSVAPMVMEGLETGYVGTYIACAPQKTKEAIAEMKRVLAEMAKKGPTPAEMTRAKNYYLGQRAMDLQSTWSLAGHFSLENRYQGRILSEKEIQKKILTVTARDVQRVAKKLFVDQPFVEVIVG